MRSTMKRTRILLLSTSFAFATAVRPQRKTKKQQFCADPNNPRQENLEHCKFDQTWKELTADFDVTWHQREFTGECGPNCRPSCVTLMLDLDKLDYQEDLKCEVDELCQCEFQKCSECASDKRTALFEEHPKCYLEDADCLGATVYDDTAAVIEMTLNDPTLPTLEHCTSIPDGDDLYCRFQDWKLVRPMSIDCNEEQEPCFDDERRIFFEYCNIREEDPSCNRCDGGKCSRDCPKIIDPFPPGWTTFVVSAPIPYPVNQNEKCDRVLDWEEETAKACFLERIEFYYPPPNEDCSEAGCPHCHDCPLLSLGDTFGPLEVVGFGHGIDTPCAACDEKNSKRCEVDTLHCNSLIQCDQSVDCETGETLGLQPFSENQCSFCEGSGFGFGEQEVEVERESRDDSKNDSSSDQSEEETDEPEDATEQPETNEEDDTTGAGDEEETEETEVVVDTDTEEPEPQGKDQEPQEEEGESKKDPAKEGDTKAEDKRGEPVFSGATEEYTNSSQDNKSAITIPVIVVPLALVALVAALMVFRRQRRTRRQAAPEDATLREKKAMPQVLSERSMDINMEDNSMLANERPFPVLLDRELDVEEEEETNAHSDSIDGMEDFQGAMVMQSESKEFETLYFTGKTAGM